MAPLPPLSQTRLELGYTPFEYWKGPKRVHPAVIRDPSGEIIGRVGEAGRRRLRRASTSAARTEARTAAAIPQRSQSDSHVRLQHRREAGSDERRAAAAERRGVPRTLQEDGDKAYHRRMNSVQARRLSQDFRLLPGEIVASATDPQQQQQQPDEPAPPPPQSKPRSLQPPPAALIIDEKKLVVSPISINQHPALRGGGRDGFSYHESPPSYQQATRSSTVSSSSSLSSLSSSSSITPLRRHERRGRRSRSCAWQTRDDGMAWFYREEEGTRGPRAWKKRTWALIAALVAVVIIVAVAVPVVTVREAEARARYNRYPDYYKLNYTLSDRYLGTEFFDRFTYYTGYDPTHGHVHYVPREHAMQLNLTYATNSTAVVKVDTSVGPGSVPNASTGRFSVRLESKARYDRGLFVFDVKHTPHGCGTWPALWLASLADWPSQGEIDVMEATNRAQAGNVVSLHTTEGCGMYSSRRMTGASRQLDCYNGTNFNEGCGVAAGRENPAAGGPTYGAAYNDLGGGVVALELRDAGIRVWQFPRSAIPADLSEQDGDPSESAPDPSGWGTATADFPSTDCDIGTHFANQTIIINITLCGDLTEAVWADSGCPGTCVDTVSNNPSGFTDAFWEFGSFRVYQAFTKAT